MCSPGDTQSHVLFPNRTDKISPFWYALYSIYVPNWGWLINFRCRALARKCSRVAPNIAYTASRMRIAMKLRLITPCASLVQLHLVYKPEIQLPTTYSKNKKLHILDTSISFWCLQS